MFKLPRLELSGICTPVDTLTWQCNLTYETRGKISAGSARTQPLPSPHTSHVPAASLPAHSTQGLASSPGLLACIDSALLWRRLCCGGSAVEEAAVRATASLVVASKLYNTTGPSFRGSFPAVLSPVFGPMSAPILLGAGEINSQGWLAGDLLAWSMWWGGRTHSS